VTLRVSPHEAPPSDLIWKGNLFNRLSLASCPLDGQRRIAEWHCCRQSRYAGSRLIGANVEPARNEAGGESGHLVWWRLTRYRLLTRAAR